MNKESQVSIHRCPAVLAAVLFGLTVQLALATEVHRWTDENGVVHFSDIKPQNAAVHTFEIGESQPVRLPPQPAAPEQADPPDEASEPALSAAQQRRQDIATLRLEQQELLAQTEVMCGRHEKRLEQMEPARRVYYFDENGQEVRMDDIERVALVEESRNYIAENCH